MFSNATVKGKIYECILEKIKYLKIRCKSLATDHPLLSILSRLEQM